jgi:hypothetical protein
MLMCPDFTATGCQTFCATRGGTASRIPETARSQLAQKLLGVPAALADANRFDAPNTDTILPKMIGGLTLAQFNALPTDQRGLYLCTRPQQCCSEYDCTNPNGRDAWCAAGVCTLTPAAPEPTQCFLTTPAQTPAPTRPYWTPAPLPASKCALTSRVTIVANAVATPPSLQGMLYTSTTHPNMSAYARARGGARFSQPDDWAPLQAALGLPGTCSQVVLADDFTYRGADAFCRNIGMRAYVTNATARQLIGTQYLRVSAQDVQRNNFQVQWTENIFPQMIGGYSLAEYNALSDDQRGIFVCLAG